MTIREQLKKKMQLLDYAQRIGMEVVRDDGRWLIVGFPPEKVTSVQVWQAAAKEDKRERHD